LVGAADEAVVERVVEDVFEGGRVLLLGLDQLRPEAAAEDVVAAAVPLVEGTRVGAVEVAHPVGEVRDGGLDDQVVVVAHQAAHVNTPAVAALDAPEDVDEDDAVAVFQNDGRLVVAACRYVVVRAGGQVAGWAGHVTDGSSASHVARHRAPVLTHVRRGPVTCQAQNGARGAIAPGDMSDRGVLGWGGL